MANEPERPLTDGEMIALSALVFADMAEYAEEISYAHHTLNAGPRTHFGSDARFRLQRELERRGVLK